MEQLLWSVSLCVDGVEIQIFKLDELDELEATSNSPGSSVRVVSFRQCCSSGRVSSTYLNCASNFYNYWSIFGIFSIIGRLRLYPDSTIPQERLALQVMYPNIYRPRPQCNTIIHALYRILFSYNNKPTDVHVALVVVTSIYQVINKGASLTRVQ